MGAVTTLAHGVAQHWVSDEVAGWFSRAVGLAASMATRAGPATVNLWEDPAELVCHIARSASAPGRSRSGQVRASTSAGRVMVHVRRHEWTVRLTL